MTGPIDALRCADLAIDAYTSPPDYRSNLFHGCLTREGEFALLAIKGTDPRKVIDLLIDGAAVPYVDEDVGPVHAGFGLAVRSVIGQIKRDLAGAKVVVIGHSMGGSEGHITAGHLVHAGIEVVQLTTFGCPRPGFSRLASLVKDLPGEDYRHGDDPITLVPILLGYVHPRPMVQLGKVRLELDPIDDHFMSGYRAALADLESPPGSVPVATVAAQPEAG
jgi:hypothetical protein